LARFSSLQDLKKAEEKLLLNQATLSATVNNTKLMIWSVDREYKLMIFNQPLFHCIKLMALRAVMNPHFVFNVLNSIQPKSG
jgi:sensor histidine kinase YesM